MSLNIGTVMRDRAESKRIFVQVFRFVEQRRQKIRAANIMEQVTEESAAERVISEILNDASAVRVAVCDSELIWCSIAEALKQDCLDVVVPKNIDQRLVCKHRITSSNSRT